MGKEGADLKLFLKRDLTSLQHTPSSLPTILLILFPEHGDNVSSHHPYGLKIRDASVEDRGKK